MPLAYRAWARLRCQDLSSWVQSWVPPEICGGIKGRSTTDATWPITLQAAFAKIFEKPFMGISYDYSACFDRVDAQLCVEILLHLGLPPHLANAIKSFYGQLRRFVKVGSTATSTFASPMGILQGCPLSALLLSAVMSTWVWMVRADPVAKAALLAIYLDDRNFASDKAEVIRRVIEITSNFDSLANGKLNNSKTQLYASSGTADTDVHSIRAMIPGCVETSRVWSLGFPIPCGPECPADAAVAKAEARFAKAILLAEKAKALPHDIRIKVLESCFCACFEYSCQFCPPDLGVEKSLTDALLKAVWGSTRPGAAKKIIWTTLYKGHKLLPCYRAAWRSLRMLYEILRCSDDVTLDTLRKIWNDVKDFRRLRCDTPFHVLVTQCRRFGWSWSAVKVITLKDANGALLEVDFSSTPWSAISHLVREAIRHDLWSRGPSLDDRWDTHGAAAGVDGKRSRLLLDDPTTSFLHRGILRTAMAGALRTPSRLLAAGLIDADQAICHRCDMNVVHTLGHAMWTCPARHTVRAHLNLHNFDEAQHPRCLTRCGLVPVNSQLSNSIIKKIQTLLLQVALQF